MRYPRIILGLLVLFELLNWVGVFHYNPDFTWLGLIVTAVAAWGIFEYAGYRLAQQTGKPVPAIAGWALLVPLFVDAMGDTFHGYSHFPNYDRVAHLAGGFGGAVVVLGLVWAWSSARYQRWHPYAAILIVSFLGALYEIEEYLEDYWTGSHRLGDGPDTANDMMLNILGALAAVVIWWAWRSTKNREQ